MDLSNYPSVTLVKHPLLTHKITILRKKETGTNEFRNLVREIATMEGYEALRNLPTEMVEIETPIEKTSQPMLAGKKLCFVPILRAGTGMLDGMLDLVPSARVGHIGLYHDEVTHQPVEYFCKLPNRLENREVFILDPMLATGGSGIDAVKLLRQRGANKMRFICIIAAPEGIKAFAEACPDVPLYVGAIDRQLNENAYICPGLGDAGDRIYGTRN